MFWISGPNCSAVQVWRPQLYKTPSSHMATELAVNCAAPGHDSGRIFKPYQVWMPYLLGLWGEIQPACSIFPVGIPPTMSQPSFSVFNFLFLEKKKKRKKCLPQQWMEPNVSLGVPAGAQGSELSSWSTSVISAQHLLEVESKWANLIFCSKYFPS